MPEITYDGDVIKEITYDGDIVKEVTYDGDVVFAAYEEAVFVAGGNSYTFRLDATGNIVWENDHSDGEALSVAADPREKRVVFGFEYNEIKYMDFDGNVKWTYSTGNNVRAITFGPDGNIYYGTDDGEVSSLDKDGNLRWSNTDWSGYGEKVYAMECDADGVLSVWTGGSSFSYRALFDTSGDKKDGTGTSGSDWRGVAMDPKNGMLYATNNGDNSVNAYSYTSSNLTYEYDWSGFHETPMDLAVNEHQEIIVACWDDNLYKLEDTGSGFNKLWEESLVDGQSAVFAPNGYIYGGDGWNNGIFRFTPTGGDDWSEPIDHTPISLAQAAGAYGTFPDFFELFT